MTDTPPRTRTVDEVAAPYANYLVRVPEAGVGVCAICHTSVTNYPTCYKCKEAESELGTATADVTAFVSMAPRGEQLARELIMYKDPKVSETQRLRMTTGLAAVAWKWLGTHEVCVARPIGVQRFDVITAVPSTSGRAVHPLRQLVAGIVSGSGARYEDLLVLNRTDLDQRAQAIDRFRATRDLGGGRVLVVDDTWTTGAHAQSACAALKAAGAEAVGVVAIGRWFNPGYADGVKWLAEHRQPGWDWTRCCLEADRQA